MRRRAANSRRFPSVPGAASQRAAKTLLCLQPGAVASGRCGMKAARTVLLLLLLMRLSMAGGALGAAPVLPGGNELWFNPDAQELHRVTLHFFWSNRCPHCLEARPFVESLRARYPWLDVVSYELNDKPEYRQRFIDMAALLGQQPASVAIFIGPEGGFDRQEADSAAEAGARLVTLGPRILRAETAGLAVCAALLYHLNEWE